MFKVNLQRLIVVIKSKLNRISYIPHSIPDIVRYLRYGFNKGFSELFPDNKLIEVLSNMYTIIKSKYKGIDGPRTRAIKSAYADFILILEN